MRKALKATISFVLTLVMILSSTSAAFAKDDVTPVVVVHGIGGTQLYKDIGTENETTAAAFDISSIFSTYNSLLKKVMASATGEKIDASALIDEIAEVMNDFADIACDKNGDPAYNVGIKDYWTDSLANHKDYIDGRGSAEPAIANQVSDIVGPENVYLFRYDWRLDACENAAILSSFIDNIKAETGKNKVTIVSCSEGTVVASAYVDQYMYKNDIAKTVFVNGAFNGVSICNLFAKDVYIDKDTLLNYFWNLLHELNNPSFELKQLGFLSTTLDDAVGNLCALLNEVKNTPELFNRLYTDVLYPIFGCIPIYWEFIPYDYFDKAVYEMSSIGFLDKSGALYSKLQKYHQVQGRLESNLKTLKSKGVEVAVVANYGIPTVPMTSLHKAQADVLIETKFASVGATVADYGETLNKTSKYISDDKIIDASTCALPDSTWFVKGIQHMDFWYNSEACQFLAALITTDTTLDIDSIQNETGIGQFIGTDSQQKIVNVTKSGSTAGLLGSISETSATTKAEKKSPPTGNSDILLAGSVSFTITLAGMVLVFVLKKKAKKSY